ncbi:cytochrome P450 [Actinophytocola sp.]|uniref:cytochrome P450 n=1 Tax=Actinophytocola sp. TaxID=1872138 RepID=UPI00389AC3DF
MSRSVPEILENIDLYADDQVDHLLDALAVARTECPIRHTTADGGYYVITRYEDVRTVCENPELFSSAQPALRGVPVRIIPVDSDPPEHRHFRAFLNHYFSRTFLLRHEEQMRKIARTAIAAFLDRGELDVVRDYAIPFSAGSLARVVFATDNQDLVQRGVAAVNRVAVESTPETFQRVAELAMEAMAEVENAAQEREDVLAALTTAEFDGRPLTVEERLGIVTALLLGGLDTTRGMIVHIAHHLATRPGVERVLRTPDWWRNPLDEFLRYQTTVSFMARVVTKDTELSGVPLRKGDRLAVHFYSANRDPNRFDHPDELDLTRPSKPNAAFGMGIHRCLGQHFARIQLATAFEELLTRTTNFRLKEGQEIRRMAGVPLGTPQQLWLTFDKR